MQPQSRARDKVSFTIPILASQIPTSMPPILCGDQIAGIQAESSLWTSELST